MARRRRDWNSAESRRIADALMPEQHDSLAAALVAALADLTVIDAGRTAKIKTNRGDDYSYKYADIGDAVKLTRPVLAAHGLVALTPVHGEGDGLACTVILLHTSGERLDLGPFPFPHGRDAQATGSMVTYHRRYALVAALGMAAGDDDDGQSAAPRERLTVSAPRPFDLERFKKACETDGLDPADVVAHAALGKSIDELTQDDRPLLLASLREMSAKGQGEPPDNDVTVGTGALSLQPSQEQLVAP
jgi:hypothetical protein